MRLRELKSCSVERARPSSEASTSSTLQPRDLPLSTSARSQSVMLKFYPAPGAYSTTRPSMLPLLPANCFHSHHPVELLTVVEEPLLVCGKLGTSLRRQLDQSATWETSWRRSAAPKVGLFHRHSRLQKRGILWVCHVGPRATCPHEPVPQGFARSEALLDESGPSKLFQDLSATHQSCSRTVPQSVKVNLRATGRDESSIMDRSGDRGCEETDDIKPEEQVAQPSLPMKRTATFLPKPSAALPVLHCTTTAPRSRGHPPLPPPEPPPYSHAAPAPQPELAASRSQPAQHRAAPHPRSRSLQPQHHPHRSIPRPYRHAATLPIALYSCHHHTPHPVPSPSILPPPPPRRTAPHPVLAATLPTAAATTHVATRRTSSSPPCPPLLTPRRKSCTQCSEALTSATLRTPRKGKSNTKEN